MCYCDDMMKPVESVAGTVTMADGTRRTAYRNAYKVTTFSVDGSTAVTAEEVRIEFRLFTNANASRGRAYRRATDKQASTFIADSEES